MFNIGFTEMIVIAALALILIGPKQLPEVARNLGRLLNDLKRSAGSFTDDIKSQVDFDLQQELRHRREMAPPKEEVKVEETKKESDV